MARIAVVVNASSGTGDCAAAAERLGTILVSAGHDVHITLARSGQELMKAAQDAVDQGCDLLVAGGGDGTVNACATAALGAGVPLGVLPLGTLNHFAKDLGIPLELEDAAKTIVEGEVCRVDVGEVNGRVFLNNSSLGVYPTIVRLRDRYRATGWAKWLAALWATLAVLRRNPFMAVRIIAEEQTIVRRTPFVFVGNNEYRMAGLHAGTRESLASGHLALYVLNAERRLGLLRLAWQVVVKGIDEVRELDLLTVTNGVVETRRRRLQVALDGEVASLESPLEYRIRAKALQVRVPSVTSACHPVPAGASSNR
jgi:diacylglycerol kinase family enzyme